MANDEGLCECGHAIHGKVCNEYPDGFRCRCNGHCDLCGANLQNGEHAKRQCPSYRPKGQQEDARVAAIHAAYIRHGLRAKGYFKLFEHGFDAGEAFGRADGIEECVRRLLQIVDANRRETELDLIGDIQNYADELLKEASREQ